MAYCQRDTFVEGCGYRLSPHVSCFHALSIWNGYRRLFILRSRRPGALIAAPWNPWLASPPVLQAVVHYIGRFM